MRCTVATYLQVVFLFNLYILCNTSPVVPPVQNTVIESETCRRPGPQLQLASLTLQAGTFLDPGNRKEPEPEWK